MVAVTSVAALFICFYAVTPVWAACVATCAVTETTKLGFGTLQKPASGSVTYIVNPNGSAASGTATLLYGTSARGQYKATRTGSTSGCTGTTYNVQNVSTGNAGITLGTWQGFISSTLRSLPFTSSAVYPATSPGTTFYIGATATITSSATTGAFSPSYDIVCTIQ
jgi:hypothetical protein